MVTAAAAHCCEQDGDGGDCHQREGAEPVVVPLAVVGVGTFAVFPVVVRLPVQVVEDWCLRVLRGVDFPEVLPVFRV